MADEVGAERVCGVEEGNTVSFLFAGGVSWSGFLLCGMIPGVPDGAGGNLVTMQWSKRGV